MRSHAKVPSALVGVLVGVITMSSIVQGFTPLPSPPLSSPALTLTAVSLYIDPADAMKPATSTSTASENSVPSPKSSGNSDQSQSASSSPSRHRRRQQPPSSGTIVVESPEEFDAQVRSEADKLVVVRFHSPYCPACKSTSWRFYSDNLDERMFFNDAGRRFWLCRVGLKN